MQLGKVAGMGSRTACSRPSPRPVPGSSRSKPDLFEAKAKGHDFSPRAVLACVFITHSAYFSANYDR